MQEQLPWNLLFHTFCKAQAQMAQPFSPWFIFGHTKSHKIPEVASLTSWWFFCHAGWLLMHGTLSAIWWGHPSHLYYLLFLNMQEVTATPQFQKQLLTSHWFLALPDWLSVNGCLTFWGGGARHNATEHLPICDGRQLQQRRWQMQCHMTMPCKER